MRCRQIGFRKGPFFGRTVAFHEGCPARGRGALFVETREAPMDRRRECEKRAGGPAGDDVSRGVGTAVTERLRRGRGEGPEVQAPTLGRATQEVFRDGRPPIRAFPGPGRRGPRWRSRSLLSCRETGRLPAFSQAVMVPGKGPFR